MVLGREHTWLTWFGLEEALSARVTFVDGFFAHVAVESQALSTVVAHLVVRSMSTHISIVAATFMVEVAWHAVFTEHHITEGLLSEADSTSVEVLNGFISSNSSGGSISVSGSYWSDWTSNVGVLLMVMGLLDTSSEEVFPSISIVTFSTTDQVG